MGIQEAMENIVFPDTNAHSGSLLRPNLRIKALLTKKFYKAFEDAWVTTTELKVF